MSLKKIIKLVNYKNTDAETTTFSVSQFLEMS